MPARAVPSQERGRWCSESITTPAARFGAFATIALCVLGCETRASSAGAKTVTARHLPDVIFVTVDTLRPDHLGYLGYRRQTSPHLDALAAEGVVVEPTIAQGAWTFTTIPALATSRFPQDHADYWFQDRPAARLAADSTTLGMALEAAGFRTAFISGHPGLGSVIGLRRGFDEVAIGDWNGREVAERAAASLAASPDRPLFLWAHFFDPHGPYEAPEPFTDRFVNDGLLVTGQTIPPGQDMYLGYDGIPRLVYEEGVEDADFYVARYDSEIAYVDDAIQRLLAAVAESRDRGPPLIVFSADHGESLLEHGLYFSHTMNVHEPITRIPWIVHWAGHLQPRRIHEQAMAIDIAPSVLGLLDLAAPPDWLGNDRSDCLRGISACEPQPAFITRGIESAIRSPPYKLICDAERCRLFDLERDPGETLDLSEERADVARALERELRQWQRAHPDERARDDVGLLNEVDDETLAALRALGYIE